MSRRTEEKMSDFVKWFVANKDEAVKDPHQAVKFLARAVHELVHLSTYWTQDIQTLEGREPGKTNLILPNVHRLDQSLREGGDNR